jgi:hypothetical protein
MTCNLKFGGRFISNILSGHGERYHDVIKYTHGIGKGW